MRRYCPCPLAAPLLPSDTEAAGTSGPAAAVRRVSPSVAPAPPAAVPPDRRPLGGRADESLLCVAGDQCPTVEAPLRGGGGPYHLRQGPGQAAEGVPRPRQDVHHRPADFALGGGDPGDHWRGGEPKPGRRVLLPVEKDPPAAPHPGRGHAGHAHRAAEGGPPAAVDERRQADAEGEDRSVRLSALLRCHRCGGRAERRETGAIHISLLLRSPGGAACGVCYGW